MTNETSMICLAFNQLLTVILFHKSKSSASWIHDLTWSNSDKNKTAYGEMSTIPCNFTILKRDEILHCTQMKKYEKDKNYMNYSQVLKPVHHEQYCAMFQKEQ